MLLILFLLLGVHHIKQERLSVPGIITAIGLSVTWGFLLGKTMIHAAIYALVNGSHHALMGTTTACLFVSLALLVAYCWENRALWVSSLGLVGRAGVDSAVDSARVITRALAVVGGSSRRRVFA